MKNSVELIWTGKTLIRLTWKEWGVDFPDYLQGEHLAPWFSRKDGEYKLNVVIPEDHPLTRHPMAEKAETQKL